METGGAPKLLGISGSLRRDSSNTKLMHEAVRAFGPAEFARGSIRLPLYDGDLESEAGIPPEVRLLADQILAADAVVISTP
jgi:chromate reductase